VRIVVVSFSRWQLAFLSFYPSFTPAFTTFFVAFPAHFVFSISLCSHLLVVDTSISISRSPPLHRSEFLSSLPPSDAYSVPSIDSGQTVIRLPPLFSTHQPFILPRLERLDHESLSSTATSLPINWRSTFCHSVRHSYSYTSGSEIEREEPDGHLRSNNGSNSFL
jgi:hypothetical protein